MTKEEINNLTDDEALFLGIYKGKHSLFKTDKDHCVNRSHALDSDICIIKFDEKSNGKNSSL